MEKSSLNRRAVVTGIGLVTPVGNSVETTWTALVQGRSGADYIKKFDAEKFTTRFACEVKDFDPLNYVEKKEARKMGAFIHYAVAAAQEAMTDSGLKVTDDIAEEVGTYISSGIGDFWAIERDRDGLGMGQGAGIMFLEELEFARRRGARVYAELVGYGMTADAFHITMPDNTGSGAIRVMQRTLKDAGIEPEAVGYINAHGT